MNYILEKFKKELEECKAALEAATNIIIISHRNPDGDSVGANLGLRKMLENMGKKVTSACADPVPLTYSHLEKTIEYINDFDPVDYDLIITVDCGSHEMMKFHETKPELLTEYKDKMLNIDHHPSNDFFGKYNLVVDDACSTTYIIYYLFKYANWHIDRDTATALMVGLYYDTGSFMHSNTDSDVLRVASDLMSHGADFQPITKSQFKHKPLKKLKIWGRALKNIKMNEKNVVVSTVSEKDFNECDAEPEDLSGIINYINSVPNSKLSVMVNEDMKGNIKGSLRTQGDTDLSKLAQLFGGGGHKKAAGFTIKGDISQLEQ